eukprot:13456-Heterococcus_DN1.PRE.6
MQQSLSRLKPPHTGNSRAGLHRIDADRIAQLPLYCDLYVLAYTTRHKQKHCTAAAAISIQLCSSEPLNSVSLPPVSVRQLLSSCLNNTGDRKL